MEGAVSHAILAGFIVANLRHGYQRLSFLAEPESPD
jgi:hypothetical protein